MGAAVGTGTEAGGIAVNVDGAEEGVGGGCATATAGVGGDKV